MVFTCKVDRVEGRKIFVAGTLHAGERLCAEASAIFVGMKEGTYQELVASREQRMGS